MEELEFKNCSQPEQKCSNTTAKKILTGVIFILVGGVILGERTGLIPWWIYDIIISWQTLLIAIGTVMIVNRKTIAPGIILIIIGGVFLIPEAFNLAFNLRNLWLPAVLISIGFISIFHTKSKSHHKHNWENRVKTNIDFTNDYINESYIFSGGNLVVNSTNFKGGKISAIFGGGKLDLSNAQLSLEGVNILEVEFIFGGMEIIVPHDWNIVIETNSIFGGFGNKKNGITFSNIDYTKELRIKGTAIFGGGEIKRV